MNDSAQIDPTEDRNDDAISPEFAAVQSTDDGFSCGSSEDDQILAYCKSIGL